MYHLSKADLYEPDFILKLEGEYRAIQNNKLPARLCMGAVYGYYRSNQGSKSGLEFWEELLHRYKDGLRNFYLNY